MSNNLESDFEHYNYDDPEKDEPETVSRGNIVEPTAFRLGIIGVGQCGGNIAAKFYETGYHRVLLVNTAKTDLDTIDLPVEKLLLEKHGAGKDREFARQCAEKSVTRIRTKMASVFQGQVDKIVVCMALGGGTGSGAGPKVVEIAEEMVRENGGDPAKDVIVMMVMPSPKIDGARPCFNALKAYAELDKRNVVRIVIDNAKVAKVVKANIENQFNYTNHWIVRTFHRFNNYAARESQHGNFDGRDMDDVLAHGRIIFSGFIVDDLDDRYDVGEIMSKHLAHSLFAGAKLETADVGACVLILNRSKVANKTMDDISNAFETLNSIMQPSSALHHGTYLEEFPANPDGSAPAALFCYVMLGGLEHPYETLNPIFVKAHNFNKEYGTLSAFLTE